MSLSNDQITALNFKDFYMAIRPYLCNSAHGGFTPIGTVISVMGKQAPHNYLVCDGTVYNIADYPELAAYFTGQFEASNFFGGDGITTFAVPDLRGEFLRGTGTNSHINQGNGAEVGVHQDATELPQYYTGKRSADNKNYIGFRISSDATTSEYNIIEKADKNIPRATTAVYGNAPADTSGTASTNTVKATTRPTNTSVLYCIATKNIFMDAGHNHSTDEQVVGTWVNGKPLYQKTITTTAPTVATAGTYVVITVPHNVSNVDTIFTPCAFVKDNSNIARMMPYTVNAGYQIKANPGRSSIQFTSAIKDFNGCTCYITIQYTKTTD